MGAGGFLIHGRALPRTRPCDDWHLAAAPRARAIASVAQPTTQPLGNAAPFHIGISSMDPPARFDARAELPFIVDGLTVENAQEIRSNRSTPSRPRTSSILRPTVCSICSGLTADPPRVRRIHPGVSRSRLHCATRRHRIGYDFRRCPCLIASARRVVSLRYIQV